MDELMPPVGSVEKKAEFIRLLLSFLLRWIISFFPVQIPGKKNLIANGQQLCYW